MSDNILIELAPGWVLAYDPRQWLLCRTDLTPLEGKKTVAGARLRPRAFISSTKTVLKRCLREKGIQPTPEAARYLDAMPDTFRAWRRRQERQPPEVQRAA